MISTLNKELKKNQEFIKEIYSSNVSNESKYYSLITSPFKVLKFKNLLSYWHYRNDLRKAVESLVLLPKCNDLYSFQQSEDLNDCQLKPVKKFIHILENELKPILKTIFNVELNDDISITASLYKKDDVLLCHDDKCEDRCIAFVYYLTGSESSGGSFDMFAHNENFQPTEVVCRLPPEENSFICFEVGNLTYHQVSEVTDEKFHRWSINGWFHSDREPPNELSYEEPLPPFCKQIHNEEIGYLNDYVSPQYNTSKVHCKLQREIEQESFVQLKKFLKDAIYNKCCEKLFQNKIVWRKRGPANRRNYEYAELNNLPQPITCIIQMLQSPMFIEYLKVITNLNLEPRKDDNKEGSEFIVELIKWTPGCYTMATDNDAFFKKPGLDMFIFFGVRDSIPPNNGSGDIVYLDAAEDEEGDEMELCEEDLNKVLLTINPGDNMMSLVYRTDNTVSFTKYINHSIQGEYYAIYATYYEADEDYEPDKS